MSGSVPPTSQDASETPASLSQAHGLVKIDGLRQPEHAVAAAEAGADLIGFIFAPARRQVTPAHASVAIAAARSAVGGHPLAVVGVFVNAGADEINAVVEEADLDLVQLHGEEPPALLSELSRPVIKAIRPPVGTPASSLEEMFGQYSAVTNAPLFYVIDGYVPGTAGGTGVRADWELARLLAGAWPVMLAGGLDAGNVGEAIRAVRPVAVDVSSGVETDGTKDAAKIAAFVATARHAFDQIGLSPG